jgi:hypothetical protein
MHPIIASDRTIGAQRDVVAARRSVRRPREITVAARRAAARAPLARNMRSKAKGIRS